MKTLKVKILLFSLAALLAISFLTSCEQEIVETAVNQEIDRVEQLESDPHYTTLISLNNQLLNEVSNAMATKNVTGEDLKNMYVNGQADLLEAFFEGTQVESIMNEIVPIANQFSSEYSDLVSASEGFDENVLEGFGSLESINLESRCSWEYGACVAAATAALTGCVLVTPQHLEVYCIAAYVSAVLHCADRLCT